jgi:hypothetical protein
MNFDSKLEARVGGVSIAFIRISVKFAAGGGRTVIRAQKSGSCVASVIKVRCTDLKTVQGLLQSSFRRWQLSDIMCTSLPRGSEVVLLVLALVLVTRP